MKLKALFTCLALCLLIGKMHGQETDSLTNQLPDPAPQAVPADTVPLSQYELSLSDEGLVFKGTSPNNGPVSLRINGEDTTLDVVDAVANLPWDLDRKGTLVFLRSDGKNMALYHASKSGPGQTRLRRIPLWLSVLPPLLAIGLALIFKEVYVSLFLGIWSGAFIAGGLRFDSFSFYFYSLWEVVEKYVVAALNDTGHISVIVFSLMIGGMVAIISRNGGMAGIVNRLSRYAKSAKSSQFVTWLLGIAIFFDDYANTLIVGNTMRTVTDKFRISREKLAYIVDSTAAPVSAVAFITTWIGAELGYIGDAVQHLDNFPGGTPYSIFIASLKYSFYPILTLLFILVVVYTGRDFGPMLKAERRARSTGQVAPPSSGGHTEDMEDLSPVEGAPEKSYNAFIPVALVILVTMYGLLVTGFEGTYGSLIDEGLDLGALSWSGVWQALTESGQEGFFMKLGTLIGNSDSYVALIWASLTGVVSAILLTLSGRIMNLADTMGTMVTGFKTMLPALIILTLAWSLALITDELYTSSYLSANLEDALNPYWMPVIIFILAALIAFSTGSSWSTMAILYPLAIPITWTVCQSQGMDVDLSMEILLNVIAVVLAASVLGDHCSPISDTTILSSLASDCNHIDHVRTQLPYALTVGTFSLLCGFLSTLLGGGALISVLLIVVSIVVLWFIMMRVGKPIEE
ncbi:MAG: Na+/H+ antiporter NhaC family protein [Bacteroidota bacterium]